ncbi:MAG: response regulator [Bacteroidales bacterium]|nr:response regulator [Bacteroidales bacterium]
MNLIRLFLPLTILSLFSCTTKEPEETAKNKSLVVSSDISNQQITSFAEDASGHIWIGTARGANKHTVYEFHQYFNTGDSLSLCDNQIRQIYCDSQNRLWFATANGICLYTDRDCFQRIPNDAFSQNVMQILEDKDGRIFLNMVDQLCLYKPEENKFVVAIPDFNTDKTWGTHCYIDESGNLWAVSPHKIRCLNTKTLKTEQTLEMEHFVYYAFMRDNGELWLASLNRLSVLDTKTGHFIPLPEAVANHPELSKTNVNHIHSYSNSALLFNTEKGLFLYAFLEGRVIHQSEDGFPFQAPKFRITTMFTDSRKNLWIGSKDQGFTVKYSYRERFNNNSFLTSHFGKQSVLSVTADRQDNLWITTSLPGVFVYSATKKNIQNVDSKQFFPEKNYFKNRVLRTFVDNENRIWLMTEMGKLICCRYDGKDLKAEHDFWFSNGVACMAQDKNGTVYAAGYNNYLYVLRKGHKEFQSFPLYQQGFVFTQCMLTLSTGELLIASFGQNIRIIRPDDMSFREIEINSHLRQSKFIPTAVYEDSRSNIWIGTYANGLFRYSAQNGQLENLTETACNDITDIREDVQGSIWVSTLFGLSKYDPKSRKFVHYYKYDGIGGNQFNERSSCRMADGTLIFGGTHGLTFFNPAEANPKRDIPLLFEDLKIHNQTVAPYQSKCIDKHLSYNPAIRLKHDQNSFSISFAALDYCEYERVNYYYMLEGFDKMWIDAAGNREAYYSNLPAGRYTFKVKITDKENTLVEAENAIPVRIFPSPAQSWWAYCIYFVLCTGAAFFVVRLLRKMKIEKESALQAKREKEQEEIINKMNMSFFSNISHEFRTPLTMISGPVMQLCHDNAITGENKKLLHIVQRSVNRMLKLVNQLMDFNKLENDALRLKVKPSDIVAELTRLIDIFRLNANTKHISLITHGLEDSFTICLDVDKLEKIIGNLLSNALKFTPSGGKITLSFDVNQNYVKVTVTDTGKGIPEDKLEKIFERYYQIIDRDKDTYNWGTGIGLYYARRLAELHHGSLKAANGEDGGAVFTLLLPVDENTYNQEEQEFESETQSEIFPLQNEDQPEEIQYKNAEKEQYKILAVDDDSEIAYYLKTLLSPHYNVVVAFDAGNALKLVEDESPDLILSDVVMPDVSGYELCRMIKDDIHLCHIPVVLVTAKTTVENQVEGLNTGADAYVTKPFDPIYLLALIKSQLKNRENVRKLLGQETKTDKLGKNILSPYDKVFMTELYRLMETELSNPELNIARITEVMSISRTKLYYKIKGLTGNNPNVFFKTYKLNRAAELLLEGKHNVSEISDITGFSALSHFSASFKKQFSVSPSEYVRTPHN